MRSITHEEFVEQQLSHWLKDEYGSMNKLGQSKEKWTFQDILNTKHSSVEKICMIVDARLISKKQIRIATSRLVAYIVDSVINDFKESVNYMTMLTFERILEMVGFNRTIAHFHSAMKKMSKKNITEALYKSIKSNTKVCIKKCYYELELIRTMIENGNELIALDEEVHTEFLVRYLGELISLLSILPPNASTAQTLRNIHNFNLVPDIKDIDLQYTARYVGGDKVLQTIIEVVYKTKNKKENAQ